MTTTVYVGVKGKVIALDRATGRMLWYTPLKGSDFVNLLVDGDRIFASSRGEVFCLEAATGRLLWHNDMPGEGWGLITFATSEGASNPLPAFEEKRRRDEAASSAADGG